MSEISIVIQGPLDKASLDHLDYYKSIGPVVIAHWESDPDPGIDLTGVTVVKEPVPGWYYFDNNEMIIRQFRGILLGAETVQTPFMIRTRSDEFYGNLTPLIEKFMQNISKIVCGNIFFRRWATWQYHIGDHLFIGSTSLIKQGYTNLWKNPDRYRPKQCPEVCASHALMDAHYNNKDQYSKEDFLHLFDIMNINKLTPFLAQWRHAGVRYDSHFPNDLDSANSIEDY